MSHGDRKIVDDSKAGGAKMAESQRAIEKDDIDLYTIFPHTHTRLKIGRYLNSKQHVKQHKGIDLYTIFPQTQHTQPHSVAISK